LTAPIVAAPAGSDPVIVAETVGVPETETLHGAPAWFTAPIVAAPAAKATVGVPVIVAVTAGVPETETLQGAPAWFTAPIVAEPAGSAPLIETAPVIDTVFETETLGEPENVTGSGPWSEAIATGREVAIVP
jgi:hypothetical protein